MNYTKAKTILANGDSNAKLAKGSKVTEGKWKTAGLSLAPYTSAGIGNVCASASEGCIASCIFTSGRGAMPNVSESRINKTRWFYLERETFLDQLVKDTKRMEKFAIRAGAKLCQRLNVFSDVIWEKIKFRIGDKPFQSIIEHFPNVQFYDYTKHVARYQDYLDGKLPSNYHLTFSMSEKNHADCINFAKQGGNIAVASFEPVPKTFLGLPCIDGDESDLRFADPNGCIVWLKVKGKGKKDTSGFVLTQEHINEIEAKACCQV